MPTYGVVVVGCWWCCVCVCVRVCNALATHWLNDNKIHTFFSPTLAICHHRRPPAAANKHQKLYYCSYMHIVCGHCSTRTTTISTQWSSLLHFRPTTYTLVFSSLEFDMKFFLLFVVPYFPSRSWTMDVFASLGVCAFWQCSNVYARVRLCVCVCECI